MLRFLAHTLFYLPTFRRLAEDAADEAEIVAEFPELTLADIRACLVFAADRERRLVGAE